MQSVGDENNGNAPGRHGGDGIQQRHSLLLRQNSGGLVQDQQLQLVLTQLTGNLGELFVAHRHIADAHVVIDLYAHLIDGRLGLLFHFLAVQGVQPLSENLGGQVFLGGLPVEEDILSRGEARDQGEFLVHHADARLQGVKGRGKLDLLSVDEDIPLVAAGLPDDVHAEEDLHQGALACAVLTHKAQHLAGL